MNVFNLYKGSLLSSLKLTKEKASAFTLAEVLITLGIIGVVAALTIPTLMQNANERANVVALKKAYSSLANAYTLAIQENGTPDTWGLAIGPSSPAALGKLAPYLKIDKDCTDGSKGCFPTGVDYKYFASSLGTAGIYDSLNYSNLRITDGMSVTSWVTSIDCTSVYGTSPALKTVCGYYRVDINGDKKPNQWGIDLFHFYFTKYNIIPAGSAQDTNVAFESISGCKDKDSDYGQGCSAWLIYNDNMDYLHCNYLDWAGKTKCD